MGTSWQHLDLNFWAVSHSDHTDLSDSGNDRSDMINHSDQNFSDPVSRDVEGSTGQGQDPVDHGYPNEISVS